MAKVSKKVLSLKEITISLNEREFAYLCTILGRTGGDPEKSLRGAATSIIDALANVGIDIHSYNRPLQIDHNHGGQGSIYFKDVIEPTKECEA